MSDEFMEEVEARAFGFFDLQQHKNGRWSAEMNLEMIAGWKNKKLPPGQDVVQEADGYSSVADEEGWACRPRFLTRESAWKMCWGWLRTERKDIVAACIEEARQGRIWRASRQNKATAHG